MSKLKRALVSKDVKVWMLIVGFVATITVNVVIDVVTVNRAVYREAVVDIRSATTDLQVLAFSFVAAMESDEASLAQARTELSSHLVVLNDLIDDPRIQLDSGAEASADLLQDAIVDFQNAVQAVQTRGELTPFWVALRDVLAARNAFLEDLGVRQEA